MNDGGDLGTGVIYKRSDYAGFWTRTAILLVDLVVVLFVGALLVAYASPPIPREHRLLPAAAFAYVYLTLVKSGPGTLGLVCFGCRVVSIRGRRPSLASMSFRLFLWILGPMHPVIDLVWLSGDEHRQGLRDKMAWTYVVRKRATPTGSGPICVARWTILSFVFLFPEVRVPPDH